MRRRRRTVSDEIIKNLMKIAAQHKYITSVMPLDYYGIPLKYKWIRCYRVQHRHDVALVIS